MINLLFPRTDIDTPSEQWMNAYFRAVRPINLKGSVFLLLVFCIITAVIPLLAFEDRALALLYLLPTAIIMLLDILLIIKSNWYYLAALLLLSVLQNFLLVCGVSVLFREANDSFLGAGIYYLLLAAMFVWVGICYRKSYKKIEEISMRRGAEAEAIAKGGASATGTPFGGGLFGGVVVVFISNIIIGAFSYEILVIACIYLGAYWLNPLIAERVIFARHHALMKKFMSDS